MARAKVVRAVDGRQDWYLVEDDLGVRYEVQSAVGGYDYRPGREYRLFTPGGEYVPSSFRLLPQCTTRRWRSAGGSARRRRATAAVMALYAKKWRSMLPQDRVATVGEVAGNRVLFRDGGSARLLPEHAGLFMPGDRVAVVFGGPPNEDGENTPVALHDFYVAGSAGTQAPPQLAALGGCLGMLENWNGYSGAADLLNGGGMVDPLQNVAGKYLFRKDGARSGEISSWVAQMSKDYTGIGSPFGQLAAVTALGRLSITANGASGTAHSPEFWPWRRAMPTPSVLPFYTGTVYVLPIPYSVTPPVLVSTYLNSQLRCGGANLKMNVNLSTTDGYDAYNSRNFYLMEQNLLPSCMVLEFDMAPWPRFLDGSGINREWYRNSSGTPAYFSPGECYLDSPFKLVYSAPGMLDFSRLRVALPFGSPGQYGLRRSWPVWSAAGYHTPIEEKIYRYAFNSPMDDYETGFGWCGNLMMRAFNGGGADVTPARDHAFCGGIFPGYFEIASGLDTTRDLYADFMAAYPFMANQAVNPEGVLPRLSRVGFYAQGTGHVYISATELFSTWSASGLECGKLEFFH